MAHHQSGESQSSVQDFVTHTESTYHGGEWERQLQSADFSHVSSDAITHSQRSDSSPETLGEGSYLEDLPGGMTANIPEEGRRELTRIATVMSQRRTSTAMSQRRSSMAMTIGRRMSGIVEPVPNDDSTLQPESEDFDINKWTKYIISQVREEGISFKNTGIAFRNLSVSGTGAALQLQETVGDFLMRPLRLGELFSSRNKAPKKILHNFNGVVKGGELLIVLGRPGSGCSTLLKTMCGELHGLTVGKDSIIDHNGIPQEIMLKEFKGEMVYNQEVDKHFPHLTVGQTLEFASSVRTPSSIIKGMSRNEYCQYMAKVAMAVLGLSHTYHTKVGNDFIRGVSGGERKRVSIAEMMLAGSPFLAWDNSTRGLDSASAFKFVQSLRVSSNLGTSANVVAIYQASQAVYDLFDKATVLYEGRQIYFGPAREAKSYFERQGWVCPARQTTGDFLTSVTNPRERQARRGMEDKVPQTAEDFENFWRRSPEFEALQASIGQYEQEYPINADGRDVAQLRLQKNRVQAKHVRPKSPYMISVAMQVRLNTKRAFQRIINDKAATIAAIVTQIIVALIVGSLFYGQPDATASFGSRGATLFLAVLMNALTAVSEITSLYSQRPIVEKHASYAFYHPATEAIAGVVTDIPIKFLTASAFNLVLYFMSGLRREPGPFFLYFLITYIIGFVMTGVFRTMAAITKTASQAMAAAGVLILALVIYTGYVVSVPQMRPWFGWIRWINPVFYAFEILVANEFHGREYICSSIIPAYTPLIGDSWICSSVGASPGRSTVNGDSFIELSYQYSYSHVWRNFGILIAFMAAFMTMYFIAVELNSSTTSTAESLVFQRGRVPGYLEKAAQGVTDEEKGEAQIAAKADASGTALSAIAAQKDVFTWKDVVYDIEIKGQPRRLLDHVSGWVKPGTLTALMGVSGAGKTTLLDALAQRTTMGVITGDMFVNGKPLDASFQRKTGYVQQQDLHLATATVRESLRFSALLRQPRTVSEEEKYHYVEEVIDMLDMRDFADAVVGVPGEGLNVEQRKLLTIGVELAAKPELLLFLDEPTSGLDSQSSWAICSFLRKLADRGMAVLCTVHQPSAVLFQQFDRLLFLAKGGRTVYFGPIGSNARTLLDYFESNGARRCDDEENPAEYMLEIVNAAGGDKWHTTWTSSPQRREVDAEIEKIHAEKHGEAESSQDGIATAEFAMPFSTQLKAVTLRVLQQYWRNPGYIAAKFALGMGSGLFIGFSFYQADGSLAGMETVLFAVFMLTTVFTTLVQQIQPLFVSQRSLYEVRERPSKAYSWRAFLIANMSAEIPYQIVTGILVYASFYYASIGIQSSERQGLVLLFCIQLLIYASSFAHMTIAALPDEQTASSIVTLMSMMSIIFCGVMQSPSALPGFWTFMYHLSPFTYWIGGIVATTLHGRAVTCSDTETSVFNPPSGQTCGDYLASYMTYAPGQLQNPNATANCQYCSLSVADEFMAGSNIAWDDRWRNFGILWAYIIFNMAATILTYYLFRVRKSGSKSTRVHGHKTKSKTEPEAEKV